MKTFREHTLELLEVKGVTHAALSKKVSKLFDDHKSGDENYETLHIRKNVHTGASKHWTGSVKAHSLGYKGKPTGSGYGGKRWTPGHVYVEHPMHKKVETLIKKHGGTVTGSKNNGDRGGFIDTSDGYRHHFSSSIGSAFSSVEHQIHKRQINEMTDEEIDAHNDSFNDKVVTAHSKHIEKKYGKKVDVNFGAIHDEHGGHGQFTSKVYHPKKGTIYVTTHYDPKTHEVHKHEDDE